MASFLNQFTHQNQQQQHGAPPPPQVPPPWIPLWSPKDNRYYFRNEQTGQTTWDLPQPYPSYQSGPPQQSVYVEEKEKKDHGYGKMALGAAAGVAGGALLAHEGHKVHEKWDQDEWRAKERFNEYDYGDQYNRPGYVAENSTTYVNENRPEYVTETSTTYVNDDRPQYVEEDRRDYYVDDRRDDYRQDDYYERRDDYNTTETVVETDEYRNDDGRGEYDTYQSEEVTYEEDDRRWD